MESLHFTTMLLLCHTLLGVNGQLNYSSPTTMDAVSMLLTTPPPGNQPLSPTTSPPGNVSNVNVTSTSPPGNGQSNSSIAPPAKGAEVNITIYVRVSTCSGASYEEVSSPGYRDLERNLKDNLTVLYTQDGVSYMLSATLQTAQCTGNYVKVVVMITFKPGIGFSIEEVIKTEVSDDSLVSLPVNGTLIEVAFIGVKITFKIKEGECKRVCCEGAGGPVSMVSSCNPQDGNNNRCQGFKSGEKKEGDHCPGEANDLCSSTCDSSEENRGSVQCPSFVLLGILAIATFFK
ncbi:uncharacterized protein LOC122958376 isoform X2 [Acropora millepora]|uniref:uncharacterized protein LOC122958376 isoform X2 n=1 Tax=Acropora millepora TaxID=45264 RepID=UPI001CF1438E|nr:uncharacterized protein LOC122958376 isoform X2 [Acropora millepora]